MDGTHWTVRAEEPHIAHNGLIGKGGYGEVHRVIFFNNHVC